MDLKNMNKTDKKIENFSREELLKYIEDLHAFIDNFMNTANKQLLDCIDNVEKIVKDNESGNWWKNED
jgi:hypothetical protein